MIATPRLRQLADILKRPLTDEEMERRRLAKAVFPYVKSFYDGYYNPDASEPYYRQNSPDVSGLRRPISNRERETCHPRSFAASMSSRGRSIVIGGSRSTTAPCCSATAIIVAIGAFAELSRANPDAPVIGTGEQALLPGFVNGHHHVGLTPVQLGSPDMPLELWFATRLVTRDLDLYLDTLYSAFEMIASGITTVQHIHGWMPGKLAQVEERSEAVIRAYEDIGMRVSYCFALRDQNHLVYEANEQFLEPCPRRSAPDARKAF